MNLSTQGVPFSKEVEDAINLRTRALRERAEGNSDNLQKINYYFTNRTPWVRMISSVDVTSSDADTPKSQAKFDANLAKNNILGFIQDSNDLRLPSGTEISEKYGVRPKAGITSLQVTSLGRFGALRDITVTFKCFSKEQIDVFEKLFMRPGASVLVEWGHSLFLSEDGDSIQVKEMGPGYQKMFDGQEKTILQVYEDIKALRHRYNYEYDGAFGLIKNFSWNFEGTSPGYDCTVVIGSCGEVIGSLEANLPLPNAVAQKYREQGEYGMAEPPLSFDLEELDPTGVAFNLNPADMTSEEQQAAQGAAFDSLLNNINTANARRTIPFVDSRTDWELSSMLKTFLYQDLHYVYHSNVIAQAREAAFADRKAFDDSEISLESFAYLTEIDPNIEESLETLGGSGIPWTTKLLGFRASLLTLLFNEEVELTEDMLSDAEIEQLNEDEELATFTRYRGMSYLRYGDLLQFLNKMTLNNGRDVLVDFDTSSNQLMYFNDFARSMDPRKCLLPVDVATLVRLTKKNISFKEGETYNSCSDIALNISMLYEVAENTRGSIKDFLDGVHNQIAEATGQLIDLDITYIEEQAKYIVVDRRSFVNEPLPTLSILGSDTFVRNFQFATSIDNRIQSSVAISLGDKSSRDDISQTLFQFHRGIRDRNMPNREVYPPEVSKLIGDGNVAGEYEEAQQKLALADIILKALYQERLFSDTLTDTLVYIYPKYVIENSPKQDLGGVILPYTLTLTTDGISGFRIMDSFLINSDVIPSSYIKQSNVGNLILGVDTTVNKGGWTVNLKTQYYNIKARGKDLRLKQYQPPALNIPPVGTTTAYNTIQHSGVILYSTDPSSPFNDLSLLKGWTQVNFNQSIQPQIIGALVELANNIKYIDPETGEESISGLGFSILITSTFRSELQQQNLAGTTGDIPVAEPGTSMHNYGGAFDFNLLGVNSGIVMYNTKTDLALWNSLGIADIIAPYGFEYGGNYTRTPDPIHIEYAVQSGTAVAEAFKTGKVVDRFGRKITNEQGQVIDLTIHPSPELAIDLRKFNNNPGLEKSEYQPTTIEEQFLEDNNLTQDFINPSDQTDLGVDVIPEDLL